jgi:hypothetical protein
MMLSCQGQDEAEGLAGLPFVACHYSLNPIVNPNPSRGPSALQQLHAHGANHTSVVWCNQHAHNGLILLHAYEERGYAGSFSSTR